MVAVNAEGDMLRIPTEREIFGENVYGQEESKLAERWKPMRKKRNRIAFQGKEDAWGWCWLMNRHKNYASYFARVHYDGNATCTNASYHNGVRPVFCLRLDSYELVQKKGKSKSGTFVSFDNWLKLLSKSSSIFSLFIIISANTKKLSEIGYFLIYSDFG